MCEASLREKYTQRETHLPFGSHLLDVLYVMSGGYENHRLLLRLHYVPQHVEQQCLLVIHAYMEK